MKFRIPQFWKKKNVAETQLPAEGEVAAPLDPNVNIAPAVGESSDPQIAPPSSPQRRRRVAALHVGIWAYDHVLDTLPPDEAVSAINEFLRLGAFVVRDMGGKFERTSGASYFATWVTEEPDHGAQIAQAMKCALSLRQEYVRLNLTRKTDGMPSLTFVTGADWGVALSAQLGVEDEHWNATVGEVMSHARALSQICVSVGTDLLVSHAFWTPVENAFSGSRVAEANLSAVSGLTDCYSVIGYRDSEGRTVSIAAPEIPQTPFPRDQAVVQHVVETSPKWMVNNGSKISGPFTPEEIAQRLYCLDFDFDCECWLEGKGNRTSIDKSGMFGGSEEMNAVLWVFDGKTIHGPVTEGFLKTAMRHGAVSPDSLICEVSTVLGWKKVSERFAKEPAPVSAPVPPASVQAPVAEPVAEVAIPVLIEAVSATELRSVAPSTKDPQEAA